MFNKKKDKPAVEGAVPLTVLEKKLAEQAALEAAPAEKGLKTLPEARAQLSDTQEQLLRLAADFDNFRKRAVREKEESAKYAIQGVLERLLPVLDNFEMALATAKNPEAAGALCDGVQMILGQFQSVLRDAGVEEINATGQLFDPTLHEAISQIETAEAAEGTVLQQFQRGYKLNGRLVRPARVIVAKEPPAPIND